ncbi:MAG TPA: hypothetical protein VLD19_12165 [Chitinophagaceae bacterium]|nr:hypothetical protein [Chitinophagaceae bacterium]
MPKKQPLPQPHEVPVHPEKPEIKPGEEPGLPALPEEDPDIIPDDDPFETPPYEVPPPGERP